ncbi:MAG: HIT family protein [Bradymonadia bacterium]
MRPRRIPRAEAVARIQAVYGDADCLMCAILEGQGPPPLTVHRGTHATVTLARFARAPGHLMVLLHDHQTHVAELAPEAWLEACVLAQRGAQVIQRLYDPRRCYVASLGTDLDHLPMTCPHVHVHVIPIFESGARPSSVLSWSDGVWDADEAWWQAERLRFREAWALTEVC